MSINILKNYKCLQNTATDFYTPRYFLSSDIKLKN